MKKFALFFSLVLVLVLYLLPAPVFAAGSAVFSLKPSADKVSPGDTVTITGSLAATEPVAAFDIMVSYPAGLLQHTGSKAGSSIDSKDDFTVDQPGAKAAGKIQVLYVDGDGGESGVQKGGLFSLTFKVVGGQPGDSISLGLSFSGVANKDIQPMQAAVSSAKMTIAAPLSTNAALASLTIDHGTLSPAFAPDITSYNVQLPADVSQLAIKASPADSQAKVNIKSPELKKGKNNSLTVTVTAASGASRTYTINAKRAADPTKATTATATTTATTKKTDSKETKTSQTTKASQATSAATETVATTSQAPQATLSGNNNLRQLQVSSGRLAPAFAEQITEYKVEVPAEINSLLLTAHPADSSAQLDIVNPDLKPGENKATVTVTAADGQKKTYTITVLRASKQTERDQPSAELRELEVEGFVLSPPFSPQRTEYVVYLPFEADQVNVRAVAESEDTRTSVSGNKDLKPNEANIITVAADSEGEEHKTYTIVAMRADQFSGLISLPHEEIPLAGPVEENTASARTTALYKILIIVLATLAVVEAMILFARRKKRRT